VDGGIRRGNNPRQLPAVPKFDTSDTQTRIDEHVIKVQGPLVMSQPIVLMGLMPMRVSPDQSIRIMAQLPGGAIEPLVWLHQYETRFGHPFLFRDPLHLPAGTKIQGVPVDAVVALLPAQK
jgi:hypothetical protein